MWTILKKEVKSYFCSPIGYIFVGLCLVMCSVFFYITAISQGVTNFEYMFYYVAQALVFIAPLLTMRMFADERKSGTEILLVTSPKSTFQIIMGKFLSAVSIIVITELCTLMYFAILCYFKMPDIGVGLTAMFGILLLSMAFISFGMFMSSITENQIIAGICTLAVLVFMWFLPSINSNLANFSLLERFYSFPEGLISLSDVTALLTTTFVFISLTVVFMERRKALK